MAETPSAAPKPVVAEAAVVPEKNVAVASNSFDDAEETAAATIQAVPVVATPSVAESGMPVVPEVASAAAATARTESIAETVDKIAEAVAGQIVVTPALAHGDGNVRITLKPTVLDGSEISVTAKDGTLSVAVVPATPEAGRLAAVALPRLETALAEHASAFRHVAVAIVQKKGKANETA